MVGCMDTTLQEYIAALEALGDALELLTLMVEDDAWMLDIDGEAQLVRHAYGEGSEV